MSTAYPFAGATEETGQTRHPRRPTITDDPVWPTMLRDSVEVHRKCLAKKKAELKRKWRSDGEDTESKRSKGISMMARFFARLREAWTGMKGERGGQFQPYSQPSDFYELNRLNPGLDSGESVYSYFADSEDEGEGEEPQPRVIHRPATI